MERSSSKQYYLASLMYPEQVEGAKVPSVIPQATATAKLMYQRHFTVSDKGSFFLVWDPTFSKLRIYAGTGFDGSTVISNTTTPTVEIDLVNDDTIIDMYRLVSASVVITYHGSVQDVKGYMIAARASSFKNKSFLEFSDFAKLEDLSTKKRFSCLDGCKHIYVPVDPEQLDFRGTTVYSAESSNYDPSRYKQLLIVGGYGLPTATNSFRIDVVRNIEYVSLSEKREYIRHTTSASSSIDGLDLSSLSTIMKP